MFKNKLKLSRGSVFTNPHFGIPFVIEYQAPSYKKMVSTNPDWESNLPNFYEKDRQQIKAIQRLLRAYKNSYSDSDEKVLISGFIDRYTYKALKEFQSFHQLPVTGRIDRETVMKIQNLTIFEHLNLNKR